ncbi:MAG: type II toxin-antitoxin system HicB family antitoxin [Chloroflexota bacterium]|nr:type II toxin-antitoxin system HicB family antitoxin [Chloroflexota bacterium]
MKDYHINLFLNEANGLWVADIPDLPGCSAHGETPEEALREVQLAKQGWLEVA